MNIFSHIDYTTVIDHLGTFAFAISGIRLAAAKKFDWFGAYIIGLVTAIGGGTTRDLLLSKTPFWMINSSYVIVTAIGLIVFLFFKNSLIKLNKTLFLFDSIGLGLFVVVGITKTLSLGFPFWVAIMMGMITGSIGGVIRDVLINEVPLIFHRDIYASACIAGGLIYWVCHYFQMPLALTNSISALAVIIIRVLAVKFHIQMPTLKSES